jgi:hypothetical protein
MQRWGQVLKFSVFPIGVPPTVHPVKKTNRSLLPDPQHELDPDGTVYGVELLNPKEQLTGDHGVLIVESGGRRQEIVLVA